MAGSSIGGALLSLAGLVVQHRWLRVAAGTASQSHRCRWRAVEYSIDGPPMLYSVSVCRRWTRGLAAAPLPVLRPQAALCSGSACHRRTPALPPPAGANS
jgi:hypothetical protein